MTRSPLGGGPGTCGWWSGRSAPSQAPAAPPARRTCTSGCRCAITRCSGSCGTGCRQTGASGMSEPNEVREKLLAEAAGLIGPDLPVGDPVNYLRSYYRHVDTADLTAAGSERAAAAAAGHAQCATNRPNGRALVSVQCGMPGTLLADRDVIDVVTDDMPFLIDTITMTLASQGIATELVIHPQLMVRRDVSGALREVLQVIEGPQPLNRPRIADTQGAPDEIAESWSHIEVTRLANGKAEAIKADLERALRDVRLAVEDIPKMKAMADRLAGQLATERDAEVEQLMRWLVDAHFTFLGYREYELVPADGTPALRGDSGGRPPGPALRGVPGTGL